MNICWTYDSIKIQLCRTKLRNGRHTGNAIATHSLPRRILLTNQLPLQPAPSSQTIPLPPSKLRILHRRVIFNNTHRTTRAHNVFVTQHTHWHKYGSEHRSEWHTFLSEILKEWFEITMKSTRTRFNTRRKMTATVVTVIIVDLIRGTLLVVLLPDGRLRYFHRHLPDSPSSDV